MNGVARFESSFSEFVEFDPTGRYGRYSEILGKGASKTVYKAFDEYEGIEVAWNQVKLYDFLQRPEDLERLYREIHLLKTLNHENIMKFCTSWVDVSNRNINFVTEMFTSGTLRQYRLKHRRVNVRAVKHWCRQILKGLLYLHSHDPPVIHRDLKCDNIFINGNQGQVKIGDLGLAAVLRKSHAVRCVGTPEFMAPEVYEEEYNELVDIYAFGMCILEMVTFEYPYSECSHPAQIYKKVISGTKPEALYKVEDPEVRQFVDKCLASVSVRLSAEELLKDPFLQIHDYETGLELLQCQEFSDVSPPGAGLINGYSNYISYEPRSEPENHGSELEINGIDLFTSQEDEHLENLEIAIKGRRREDDGIFLRLRIADKEDHIRNIYFPFDIEVDTALSVATEMIAELDIADHDVLKIAGMIDGEITTLVPEWKRGKGEQEISDCTSESLCANCASRGYLLDYVSSNSPGAEHLQVLQCSKLGCAAIHGRFEEITYQVEGQEQSVDKDCTPSTAPKQSSRINYADIWALRDPPESSPHGGRDPHYPEGMKEQSASDKEDKIINVDVLSECAGANSIPSSPTDDYENEIRQELRWLKAKYQLQLRELRDHQLGVKSRSPTLSPGSNYTEHKLDNRVLSFPFESPEAKFMNPEGPKLQPTVKCFTSDAHTRSQAFSSTQMLTAKSFYSGVLLPHSLHRG